MRARQPVFFKNLRILYKREWRVIRHGIGFVFKSPLFVIIALIGSILTYGTGIWLANVGLVRAAFHSPNISNGEFLRFMFEMYELPFRGLGGVQLALFVCVVLLSGLVSGFWWYAVSRPGEDMVREHAGYGLVLGVMGVSMGIFGVSLFTPVLSVDGIVTGIDGQVYGTLLTVVALIALSGALSRLSEAADRLRDNPRKILENTN